MILRRYVLAEFLRFWGLLLAAFTALYLVVDFVEKVSRLSKYDPSAAALAAYFAHKVPLVIYQVLPISVFLGALLAFGTLARRSEITAARAGGVSVRSLAAPLVAVAAFSAIFSFAFNETLVPRFTARAEEIRRVDIERKELVSQSVRREFWLRSGDDFHQFGAYDPRARRIEGLRTWRLAGDGAVRSALEARDAVWEDGGWIARDGRLRVFAPDGSIERFERFERMPAGLAEPPEALAEGGKKPEAMNYAELSALIARLRAGGQKVAEYETDLHAKLAISFAPILTVLLAVPFAVRTSRAGGMAASLVKAVALGFGYYVVFAVSVALGHAGALPPAAAAWTANGAYGILGGLVFARADR